MSHKNKPINLNDPLLRSIDQPRTNAELVDLLQKKLGNGGGVNGQDELLAMSHDHDPFNLGREEHLRMANWFMDIWHKFNLQPGVHLRAIHYKVVSQVDPKKANGKPYKNVEPDWVYLNDASRYARALGYIGYEDLKDQRNPEPQLFHSTRTLFANDKPELSYYTGEKLINGFPILELETFSTDISSPTVRGYNYYDALQPYHIEIWCEKSTMEDIIVPICQEHHIDYWAGIGFAGLNNIKRLLKRANDLGKPTIIFYISDLDAQGVSMPVQVSRWIEFCKDSVPDIDFKLVPLCLTLEQVTRWDLPTMPVEVKSKKKNKTKKPKKPTKFEKLYGDRKIELDALEAKFPGKLREIILAAILPYQDLTLKAKLEDSGRTAQNIVNEEWNERTKEVRAELEVLEKEVNPIIEEYQAKFNELRDELTIKLTDYNDKLHSKLFILQGVAESLDDEIDLPEISKPECKPPQRDWLYDSSRSWVDQLQAYKRTHSGETIEGCDET